MDTTPYDALNNRRAISYARSSLIDLLFFLEKIIVIGQRSLTKWTSSKVDIFFHVLRVQFSYRQLIHTMIIHYIVELWRSANSNPVQ